MIATVTDKDALRRLVAVVKLLTEVEVEVGAFWHQLQGELSVAEMVLRDGRDKAQLADEVIAALEAMHKGCAVKSWTGWQNGDGEEVGDRLERAVQAYKAAPVLRDGEKQEPVASVSISNWRGLENVDFQLSAALPDGTHQLYTHPAPSMPAVGAVPEGFALVPTEINAVIQIGFAYLDAAREATPVHNHAFSHVGWRALLEESKKFLPVATQPAAAPSGDVGRERDRYKALVVATQEAILTYYDALSDRQHGGVAQDKAFNAIQEAFGMYWQPGADHRAITATKGKQ